jgi:hypothetical protein
MENSIPVVDSIYTRTQTINNVKIQVMNIKLYTSVSVIASMFSDKSLVDTKIFNLEGTDYTNWGNDDDYIINYVLTQLGLTKLPASAVQAS